jgi:hypothetical protein
MLWDHVIHVLGMSHATRAFIHATRHVMCPLVLVTWKVMGAKHEKVGKRNFKKGQWAERGEKNALLLLY